MYARDDRSFPIFFLPLTLKSFVIPCESRRDLSFSGKLLGETESRSGIDLSELEYVKDLLDPLLVSSFPLSLGFIRCLV